MNEFPNTFALHSGHEMGDPMHFLFAICEDVPPEAEQLFHLYGCAAILATPAGFKVAVHLKLRSSPVST